MLRLILLLVLLEGLHPTNDTNTMNSGKTTTNEYADASPGCVGTDAQEKTGGAGVVMTVMVMVMTETTMAVTTRVERRPRHHTRTRCNYQTRHDVANTPPAGLEPAIFGLGVRRLVH